MRPPSYVWTSSSRRLSVHLPLDLVQRLGFAAMEAFKSVPRRGLEIGGLLLGRSEQRDGVTLIYLENFAPVESEHRTGPSFVLSESDLEKLDKLAKHSDAIGMYRTQTRSEDLSLQPEDSALFQRYFAGANRVFLLIQPASRRAALYLATDEGLTLAHELPFHPADLPQPAAPETREPLPAPLPQPFSPANRVPAVARGASPGDAPDLLPRVRRWLVPAAACALGLAIGAATIHYRSGPPVETRASYAGRVGLNVERAGGGLKLQWDRGSATLRNASHAILYISDGIRQSKMDLGPRELTSGAVSYWPESQDVTFRLEVISPGGNTTDSIRFMAAGPNPNAPVTLAPEPVKQAAATKPDAQPPILPTPAHTSRPKKPIAAVEKRSEGSASREEIAESKPSPFRSTPEAPVTPVATSPAPTASQQAANEPVRVAAARPSITPPPVRPALRDTGVTVTAEPIHGSRFGRMLGKIPLVRRLKKQPQAFVPPRVLKEVRPALSARERDSLKRPVPIDVKVYVTESGKVEYAELLSGSNHRDLAAAAVYAARRWDFAPAVLGEEKVPGEVVLHFRFEP